MLTPFVQTSMSDPCVVPGQRQSPLTERSSHSWASEYGSRHPVETEAEARAMDASSRGREGDMENFWPSSGGPVWDCFSLSDSSSSIGARCHGTDMAEASSVHLSPDCSAPGSSDA